eukprot:GABV01000834.1.p1 GENE.GABV01000834.1~~GABV01000834.1.p1  ORF type:complete len:248 (-),score=64.46 GABV01000834.1:62-805(-)
MDPTAEPDSDQEPMSDDDDGGDTAGLYRAPRIDPVALLSTKEKRDRELQRAVRQQERLRNSEIVQSMQSAVSNQPEEWGDTTGTGLDVYTRPSKRQQERQQFEEDNFFRLNDTKQDKKRRRQRELAAEKSLSGALGKDLERDMDRVHGLLAGSSKNARKARQMEQAEQEQARAWEDFLKEKRSGKKRKKPGDDGAPQADPLNGEVSGGYTRHESHLRKKIGGKNSKPSRGGGGKPSRGGRGGRRKRS